MCGRYSLETTIEKLKKKYGINTENNFDFSSRAEVFPSNQMPVILSDKKEQNKKIKALKWGFSPSFTSRLIINARAETVEEKPTFKKAFYRQRCLVPATAFFEWQKTDNKKIKYKISLENRDLFSFAGIYDTFQDQDKSEITCFSIITTAADDKIVAIHHRMPAILEPEAAQQWLDPGQEDTDSLKKCLNSLERDFIWEKED